MSARLEPQAPALFVPAFPTIRPEMLLRSGDAATLSHYPFSAPGARYFYFARNAIHWEDHPTLGRIPMQNAFPKFSETPGKVRRPAPDTVGQHTAEVLAEALGMNEAKLADLRRSGVIAP